MNTDNPTIHHTLNGVAALAAPVSIWSHAPEVVTFVVGLLGALWYGILIGEKIAHYRRRRWPRNH